MKCAAGNILYIGKAKSLRNRVRSYRNVTPAQVGKNIIALLKKVRAISWELHDTEEQAYRRELELIRAVNPPYNIADNWQEKYLFIAVRKNTAGRIEFRLTHRITDGKGFKVFGCFRHRGQVKRGYSALLRLMYATLNQKQRFAFPAKISRPSPLYRYEFPLLMPKEWDSAFYGFLSGNNEELLRLMVERLLDNDTIPPFMRYALQDDIEIVRDFFRNCAEPNSDFIEPVLTHAKLREKIKDSIND